MVKDRKIEPCKVVIREIRDKNLLSADPFSGAGGIVSKSLKKPDETIEDNRYYL